jgi:selenide, water dikinase
MHDASLPLTQDLVLIGGGHSHALLLRRWGMYPVPGVRVTVINPGPTAPYSGMLPGFVGGHYNRDALDIDLVKLARFAGARVIDGAAKGLNLSDRTVDVPGRPPIAYDVASVDIGITSDMPALPGFAEHGVPAKPLGSFAARWQEFRDTDSPAHIAVIGGGVAGVELILAMAHALKARNRLASAHLIDSDTALAAIGARARDRLLRALADHGVTVIEDAEIASVAADHLTLGDGRRVRSDFTTGAAGARPYDWIAQTGLDLQDGFISVDAHLRSSDPAVFAVGDCAHLSDTPRPKAGVYAVRQAPILYHNLSAVLTGQPMMRYRAQKDYLKLISMGGKSALGERFGTTLSGPMMWRWKNHIDQSFMNRFRHLPEKDQPEIPSIHAIGLPEALGDKPMCGGCGSKVGRSALRRALDPLTVPGRDEIAHLPGDDAAVLTIGSARQVISADHLRAFTHDPVVLARIAAVHALGDIWAMGATPQAAVASVTLPRLSPELQERTLREIMTAATQVMQDSGAAIVGGHSSVGSELTVGFTVTGLCERDPITLAGGRAGDALILTKPIGSGVLMAAEMAGAANGCDVMRAVAQMSRSQGSAASVLSGAHAMTDVTGFGLVGHLQGLCEASQLAADLIWSAVPLMQGAGDLARAGIRSSLYPENRALAPDLCAEGAQELLFDPQTAGGLLAVVAPETAEHLTAQLNQNGETAAVIGHLCEGPPAVRLV